MSPIIAVVDDDPRTLESLQTLLESADYTVRPFSSGTGMLESRYMDIHCLISDIGMPGMDGFALAQAIRATRPGLPIIFVTARVDLPARFPAAGNYRVFRKPFDAEELLAAVGDAVRKQVR
jgi:FixJ family two-component response regulator